MYFSDKETKKNKVNKHVKFCIKRPLVTFINKIIIIILFNALRLSQNNKDISARDISVKCNIFAAIHIPDFNVQVFVLCVQERMAYRVH